MITRHRGYLFDGEGIIGKAPIYSATVVILNGEERIAVDIPESYDKGSVTRGINKLVSRCDRCEWMELVSIHRLTNGQEEPQP